jgi:hypothetical protein
VIEFEFRLRFAPVAGEKILQVLPRLSSLPNYEPAQESEEAQGWLYHPKLPLLHELVVETILEFSAGTNKSGPTERYLPIVAELSGSLEGIWYEHFGNRAFHAWARFLGDSRRFCFEKHGVAADEGWPLVEQVVEALALPVALSPPSRDVAHAGGLSATLIGSPRGLDCEIPNSDLTELVEYFRKFGQVIGVGPAVPSWSIHCPRTVARATAAYDALIAAKLPVGSTSLSYQFPPPPPELLPRFHALCTKPKDSFTIPVGWFAAVPGLRGKLEIEINRKGLELNVVVEGELDENDELPSKGAFKELRASLPKLLDLPLTRK